MKTIFTKFSVIIILVLTNIFTNVLKITAEEKWTFQTPYPTVNDLNFVKFLNQNTIITVGNNGTILKSFDYAKTWNFYEYSPYNLNYNFNSIDIDKNGNGFLAYQNLVYKVTNNGSNYEWSDISFRSNIRKIYFSTPKIVFAIGIAGTLSRSYNGGENWIQYFEDTNAIAKDYNFNNIKFYDQEYGYVFGENNLLYYTTNSGLSWYQNYSLIYNKNLKTKYNLIDISIKDTNNWHLLTETGQILSTKNGGIDFTIIELNDIYKNDRCIGIREVNNKNISENYHLIFTSNSVFKTTDFINLEPVLRNNDVLIKSYDVLDNQIVLVGSKGLVFYSDNYGLDWELKSKSTNLVYAKNTSPQMKFIDDNIGFILESRGNKLFKSINQGLNWELDKTFEGLICNNMHFINEKVGLITCDKGRVIQTKNGGIDWDTLKFDTKSNFLDIKFADDKIGIIYNSGENYQYWTYDGGETWKKDSMIVDTFPKILTKPITSIWFVNDKNWFRYNNLGSVFDQLGQRSTDQGKSWENSDKFSILNQIKKIYKVDSLTYFGINYDGIFESYDGALSFKKRNYPYAYADIIFTDNQTGYAIGSNRIYKTTNKGITWVKLYSQHSGYLTNIHFFKNGKGIISGSDGVILTNEEIISSVEDNNSDDLLNKENPLHIFPNPIKDNFTINLENLDLESIDYNINYNDKFEIRIFAINGEEVYNNLFEKNLTNEYQISLENMNIAKGNYIVELKIGNKSYSCKMTKE